MHDFSYYLHTVIDFFRDGIHEGFARVNAVLGLIIGIFSAYLMHEWKRIWAVALGAVVMHLVAVWAIPILDNRAEFRLPPDLLELSYWKTALALYLGYLIIISVFFFIKTRVLPGGKH